MSNRPDPDSTPWLVVRSGRPTTDELGAGVPVDGSACRTRQGLFTELARALDLPGYFGANWDALADSLRDLGDRRRPDGPGARPVRRPLTLIIVDAQELLAAEPASQLGILLRVTGGPRTGGAAPPPIRLQLYCPAAAVAGLRTRLTAAGASPV